MRILLPGVCTPALTVQSSDASWLSISTAGDWHKELKNKLEVCRLTLDTGVQAMLSSFVTKVRNHAALKSGAAFHSSLGATAAQSV